MPGGDRTGPAGMGPMTGRAAGFCAGYAAAGFTSSPGGRGFGGRRGGRGGGRGRRNWFHATGVPGWQRTAAGWPAFGAAPTVPFVPPTISQEQELDALKRQADGLSRTLEDIKARIAELEPQPK